MKYRKLGNTGLIVSEVALGSMQFGGKMNMGDLGQEDTTQMVKQALDRGINCIDTADVYSLDGTTVSAVAVAWTVSWPEVTGAIVGARSPNQVDGWIQAGAIELTPDDLEEIARSIRETQAGSGPVMPIVPEPVARRTSGIA
jgi:aryl-alcohol dehydrogenase-like predicted oxidoreductase